MHVCCSILRIQSLTTFNELLSLFFRLLFTCAEQTKPSNNLVMHFIKYPNANFEWHYDQTERASIINYSYQSKWPNNIFIGRL